VLSHIVIITYIKYYIYQLRISSTTYINYIYQVLHISITYIKYCHYILSLLIQVLSLHIVIIADTSIVTHCATHCSPLIAHHSSRRSLLAIHRASHRAPLIATLIAPLIAQHSSRRSLLAIHRASHRAPPLIAHHPLLSRGTRRWPRTQRQRNRWQR